MSEANHQAQGLAYIEATGQLPNFGDDIADVGEVPETPVAKFSEDLVADAAGVPKALLKADDAATNATFAKRFRNLSEPMAYGMHAAMQRESHAARSEEKTASDGSLWKYEYSTSGELLSAHQIDSDGGPLAKVDNLDFNDIDADARIHAEQLNKEWGADDPQPLEI
jgi:hypothetical protein